HGPLQAGVTRRSTSHGKGTHPANAGVCPFFDPISAQRRVVPPIAYEAGEAQSANLGREEYDIS
ncbi:MAG: hypothetical protein ACXVCT_20870, partial [Ktedonobacterales bacterium]